MTVRVERTFDIDAPPADVWEFIADPVKRAGAISVVDTYEVRDDGSARWQVRLPIPAIGATVTVETEEVTREPPRLVKFVGRSKAFRVTGEHRIEEAEGTTRLHNEFVVDGRLPGVERFFTKNLDSELENLEQALRADVEDGA